MSDRGRSIAAFLILAFITSMAFNNCGRVSSITMDASQFVAFESKLSLLAQSQTQSLPADFCLQAKNYTCVQSIFSPQREAQKMEPISVCLELPGNGIKLCPDIHAEVFNTASASANCVEDCDARYDYTEFDCALKLSGARSGEYPLVATANNLDQAFQKIYSACMALSENK